MSEEKKKKNLIQRLRNKYRLVIYNDSTFEEVWFMRLSRLNLIAVFGTLTLLFIAMLFIMVAYTSVRELIPGYPNGSMRKNIIENAIKLDSVEYELRLRDQYLQNIKTIMSGKEPASYEPARDSNIHYNKITFTRSAEDSLLRQQVEHEDQFSLAINNNKSSPVDFNKLHFFSPIRGLITNSLDLSKNHFGVDIVAGPNEVVKACLEGTITLASWTLETGYVIQIQHENGIVSVYKHNAELLKKVGSRVKTGEAIAIIGNSGEITTGPHLHFEIWHNGTPLDPEIYIVF